MLRLFSFREAIKIPCLVRYNTKLVSLKGLVRLDSDVKFAMIQIGFGNVGIFDNGKERSIIQLVGLLEDNGPVFIGHGGRICVSDNGYLNIGKHFSNTAMGTIVCNKEIIIGAKVATSWNSFNNGYRLASYN